ncbi:hypothetical protein MKZ38_006924 [Zalerion maritima]|uniref:Uncharacterized protein n=1 Tax=Zalerion maritima TaxID=339359 RepID=A0AAD5RX47_9PEZI|nr:hypothetical protein MKZ38_006924 [Zalerion maritima]
MIMSASYEHFSWNQTGPGVWGRATDEAEVFYSSLAKLYEGSGRMFFAITGHLSIEFDCSSVPTCNQPEALVDTALRNAWLTLRHHHPTIASQVVRDPSTGNFNKVYRTLRDADEQEAWLVATCVKVWTDKSGVEWANSDPPSPHVPTLFIVDPPSPARSAGGRAKIVRRDLVFRSPHDIIDGIGTLLFFRNLVKHASEAFAVGTSFQLPSFKGTEVKNLSPPYRVAAAVSSAATEAREKRLVEMAEQGSQGKNGEGSDVKVLTVPFKHGATLPGMHQRVAVTISKDQSSKLLAACAAKGATVTHAFHAAIPVVLRDICQETEPNGEAKHGRYVNYILRNERASCVEPYGTDQHPVAVYHSVSGGSLTVDLDLHKAPENGQDGGEAAVSIVEEEREFRGVLNQMKEFYHGIRNDPEHAHLAPHIWASAAPELPPISTTELPPVPPPKTAPSVSISSMGRVDSVIPPEAGALSVHDPWVTGEELTNGLGLFLGTYRGRVCLSGAYNDAWHDGEEVVGFLRRCERAVFRGLGIE